MTLSRDKLQAKKETDPLTPEEWVEVRDTIEACQDVPSTAGYAVAQLKENLNEERCQSHATRLALLCLEAQEEISRYRFFASLTFTPWNGKPIRAGRVVRLKDGTYYLVGEVNEQFGQCDCCDAFRNTDIDAVAHIL